MSAKGVVQSLQDSELIRLFLDFIGNHRLHYDKHHKEISYKCYEATWTLSIAKATGYGRTQTQAYKNSLKNLLELLMEDPTYVEYFSNALPRASSNATPPSPVPAKVQLKTQGHDPEDKKNFQTFNKMGRQSQYGKIHLTRSNNYTQQNGLQQAKKQLNRLKNKYAAVQQQNGVLRERLAFQIQQQKNRQPQNRVQSKVRSDSVGGRKESENTVVNLRAEKYHGGSQKKIQVGGIKPNVPKLNLQVLPNYHKKSQKCLNEMLLQAWQDKHKDKRVL